MTQLMKSTHVPSMNLRLIERKVGDRTMRVLQQMMVPENWKDNPELDEFWRDVPCFNEDEISD